MNERLKATKVLVLGGSGFIGRHAVDALRSAGATVTLGTRNPKDSAELPEEQHVLHEKLTAVSWRATAERFDTILNCVGILRQRRGENYTAVHHQAPQAIAAACAQAGTRFVHVSALGLSADARSRFLTSKFHGEEAIRQAGGDWVIARLSLLDGEGGYGAAWLRGVARLPLFAAPRSARGRIAALTATDAGEALMRLATADAAVLELERSRIFELGGDLALPFADYLKALRRRTTDQPALCVPVPGWAARLGAHLCDLLHFSPFSFGHWELLCRDNVPDPNRLAALLGRAPTPVVNAAGARATGAR